VSRKNIASRLLRADSLDEAHREQRIQQIHSSLFRDAKALANFLWGQAFPISKQPEELLLFWPEHDLLGTSPCREVLNPAPRLFKCEMERLAHILQPACQIATLLPDRLKGIVIPGPILPIHLIH